MPYDALALAGGWLLPLAFAPFDFPACAVVALFLLFVAWSQASPGRAFLRGYLFGLGQFGFGASWIYISMHDYGGASAAEAGGLTLLFTLFWALYPGFAGWLAARCYSGHPAFSASVVFPAAYTLADWLRSWFPTGFPWLQVGYSQIDTPLAGLAPVLGSYGVGWATALLAGLTLALVRLRRPQRPVAAVSLIVLVGASAALQRVDWTRPAGAPFKATLLQGNIPEQIKWQPEFQRQALETYLGMTREHWGSPLIVWPETAVPAFYQQVETTVLADLSEEARRHGTDLLVGIPFYDRTLDRYYNSVAVLGRTAGFYFKRHLVPFGEYVPLRPVLGWVLDILQIPLSDFAPGSADQPPLVAAGYPLGASICYEDTFGHESLANLPDATYLVNVTNDGWFGDSIATHQHVQMARMRALETGRYMLRATNTGITAIITPKGAVAATAPPFQKAQVSGTITPMQGSTPYILWGDVPTVAGFCALLGGLAWWRYRPAAALEPRATEHDA
ncbi:apolipoprotein N-acyltransferase [Candidatus Methylocalor cossyra]|uniref:Apolipoprotein N-acyltransferase n=1 Tax=Candidatus Methylocalor cossyra TaxID=3108543 RepID=A0ABP1C575_9GAMM